MAWSMRMAEPVKTHVTPNGMMLAHYEKPYWSYTVALHESEAKHGHPWTPDEPWGRVPSVTSALGVLDKSRPLVIWATRVTYEACASLTQTYGVPPGRDAKYQPHDALTQRAAILRNAAQAYDLDHDSVTSEAGLRGSAIHLIGENWVKYGAFPVLSDYDPAWRGYVRAIAGFLSWWKGDFQMAEVITGSAIHGYAGTCDTVAVATGTTGRRFRLDYKTSRQVYARSHFRQLEGYEHASIEGGEDPTDERGIVCLYSNGEFEVVLVPPEHKGPRAFLNTLAVWRDEQPLKKLEDAAFKARKARERKAAAA